MVHLEKLVIVICRVVFNLISLKLDHSELLMNQMEEHSRFIDKIGNRILSYYA